MLKKLLSLYYVPLFTSLAIAIVYLALNIQRDPIQIAMVILGSLAGTFLLDFDYLVYIYILEPESDFSKTVSSFIKHGDFMNAISYIQYHKNEVPDKTLQSIIFQIVLAGTMIFVNAASGSLFLKTLVLSSFANSIYRLLLLYFADDYEKWFWALKKRPTKQGIIIYIFSLSLILVSTLIIF